MTGAAMKSSTGAETEAGLAELTALARAYEPERYLAATLAPKPQQAVLIVLAAYAADLQRIPATATQPMLGEIRLQWWRDSLELIAKGSRIGSPLADALGKAIRTYDLPLPLLVAMSEARAWELYDDPMSDQAALDGYLSKTEAVPFELALRMLGMPAGDAGALSQPAGRLFGMTRLLARLPVHLAAGRQPFPETILAPYGISAETLLTGNVTAEIRRMIVALADDITAGLAALRPQLRALSRIERVALLPLAAVPPYLGTIVGQSRDPVRDVADLAPLARLWRIAGGHVLGRI